MGIFGISRSKTVKEPRSSDPTFKKRRDTYSSEDEYVYRRDRRKSTRSPRETGDDGFATDAPAVTTDYEEAARRRAEKDGRRDRRAEDARIAEERIRAKEREREARKQEARDRRAREDEARRSEEKEARRVARADRRAREEEERQRELERDERRARRRDRDREREQRDRDEYAATQRRSMDRRKSYAAGDERRKSRVYDDDAKRRPSRRDDDYYEPRGSGRPPSTPYLAPGGDKTASWVNSVNENPPEPIPAEDVATIIEPKPAAAAADKEESSDAEEARPRRRRDRRDRDPADEPASAERSGERRGERLRRRGDNSGGSGDRDDRYARRRSYADGYGYDGYERPAAQPRKQSFFKKLATFGV